MNSVPRRVAGHSEAMLTIAATASVVQRQRSTAAITGR